MLKALEIVGFKSFADKTQFDFPPGITVIVGPNGSGKSNIVDAIKWVLGEQSVKSLRGREMADVIFNGSGSRRAMNFAEITLTLDNSARLLALDAPEVHITRRVYRSGEGEYLVNRQPCRLRDIRELLVGTGLGTHAYSVIEQGKVDVLLQSSAQDRRVIFEEAAGIGRFKLKKIEALRRLERVEQNLLRLHDIVDEVESRLRSVKLQAGKARRYKEYADRLQELRTQVGLVDWRRLSERLADLDAELASLRQQRDEALAEAEALEARLLEAEIRSDGLNEAIRQSEQGLAANRERIAGHESTIEHQRARCAEWEQEIARCRRQLAEMTSRAGEVERQLQETTAEVQSVEEHRRQIARSLAQGERELTDLIARLDLVRGQHHERRAAHAECMRQIAGMGSQIGALEGQVAAAEAARQKNEHRAAELQQQVGVLRGHLQGFHQERETLAQIANDGNEQLGIAKTRVADLEKQQASRQADLASLHQRRSGMVERAAVLEELEKRYEGLSPGVKEVLTFARQGQESPFRAVRGLVADLFQVGVEAAALVETALGEKAQYVVVGPGPELLEHLQQNPCGFAGRVGFLWLDKAAETPQPSNHLEGRPGVLGRADRFVEAKPEYASLVGRLLGQTWIVQKLSDALALRQTGGAGSSFVTLSGELLAADGALTVGPRQASIGLISRRSELRALKAQLAELETTVQQTEAALARLEQHIVQEQQRVVALTAEHRSAVDALQEHSHKITAAEARLTQLEREQAALQAELQAAAQQHQAACQRLDDARARRRAGESELADIEAFLASLGEQIERLQAEHQVHSRGATEIKVELAKSEERLRNLRGRMRQFEESQQERLRAIAESRQQLAQCRRAAEESQRDILAAEAAIADLYLAKEAMAAQTVSLVNQREVVQQQRAELTAASQHARGQARRLNEKLHARDLAANEVRHERSALADRLREDYGIELAQLEHHPTEEEQHQREEVQQEIDELRRKINNLGNVNLEALDELEQLEARHKNLSDQYEDLNGAKNSLVKIIERINADSRRLFAETLQTVKEHFGNLFRDLFGGGRADILLEEGVDVLESGIEIVARPPGKEPRSISLLSGGEKTLTCTALLLAIFRSRPSPFCVLDEVDAALDEPNIDRFIKVLRDFLTWTQFVIVTHSKKTMTCANTIYGVTMQESGVSKRVSVRFEDVSENGEFRMPAEPQDGSPAADLKADETRAA